MCGNDTRLRVVNSPMSESDGTYSFCANCPTSACCSKVRPGGRIDSPILFPGDVRAVERFTGESADRFSVSKNGKNHSERLMRTGSQSGCYFYRDGKCAIYHVRPLDCRLFPFDIIEKSDGRLVWIVYTRLCPTEYDHHAYFEQAKKLLPRLGSNLHTYARAETPAMEKEPCIELEEVDLDLL